MSDEENYVDYDGNANPHSVSSNGAKLSSVNFDYSELAKSGNNANVGQGGMYSINPVMGSLSDLSLMSQNGQSTATASLYKSSQDDHSPEKVVEISPNGRYAKLQTLLGKGAYKVVYKAIDREEGYEVAWNCCQTSKAAFQELSDEIDILKRVRHPNIIQFHDCWWNANEFVFITELMTSGTLREYIPKLGRPNLKIIKRWSRQILKGLAYLHSHNPPIIHRDIKCDNIFINGAHGEVKIGDMGTAKMRQGKKYTVIGTPEFMAPEMYEERGYSEKVDIYAFGMALLEMVTGEYPYSECKNAAQIYKKVSQGLKPNCLSRVSDPEVLDLINHCIDDEGNRPSSQELLEHPFLAVEPEVILLTANETRKYLEMQVVFKGMEKLSVKFEFNVETDTAEDVVNEMIQEQVLPNRYQQLITSEINRILREMNKYTPETDRNREENKTVWLRHDESHSHGYSHSNSASQMPQATGGSSQQHISAAEAQAVEPLMSFNQQPLASVQSATATSPAAGPNLAATVDHTLALEKGAMLASSENIEGMESAGTDVYSDSQDLAGHNGGASGGNSDIKAGHKDEEPVVYFGKEYDEESIVEDLVRDVALANNRGVHKADEWVAKLKEQDIMTIGDLRELHNQDWASLGLTVFASRALKNALHGKQSRNFSPRNLSRSGSIFAASPMVTAGYNPPPLPPGAAEIVSASTQRPPLASSLFQKATSPPNNPPVPFFGTPGASSSASSSTAGDSVATPLQQNQSSSHNESLPAKKPDPSNADLQEL